MKAKWILPALAAILLAACGNAQESAEPAAEEQPVAESTQPVEEAQPTEEAVAPVEEIKEAPLPDGVYSARFDTDGSMFHVNEVYEGRGTLYVEDGSMRIHITLPSKNTLNLYYGLAEDAQKDGAELIEPTIDSVTYSDGMTEEVHGFDIPVPYLDEEFDVALVGSKGTWYDHKVKVSDPQPVEDSGSAELSDGDYELDVSLSGGSGKAYIVSPAKLHVEGGQGILTLEWSSPNYDYMLVDGEKYLPVNTDGNSVFEIPINDVNAPLTVIADTTAMSEPHEIEYTLSFELLSAANAAEGLVYKGSMRLHYAECFSLDYYEGGYEMLTIKSDGTRYLLVPAAAALPKSIPDDVCVLKRPVDKVYMVASASMGMVAAIDAMDSLSWCGLKEKDWYVEEARAAMHDGALTYAGKYSAPDYEQLLAGGCRLAVENMMITHSPEVIDKLKELGIAVLTDHASDEPHALGRVEWVKFYGALFDKEAAAEKIFSEQEAAAGSYQATGRSVAFFYIRNDGAAVVRRSDDYVPEMIRLAGGEYVLDDVFEDNRLSTSVMQMEDFYAAAKDADVLIYNGTTAGEVGSINELLKKSELLSAFKAVKNKEVYSVSNDLYQSTMQLGSIIADMNAVLTAAPEGELSYIKKLH